MEQQLCAGESGRPRMSVEEQLERIRRHQQGALREKKKGLSIRGGSQENTPSRSHSFNKENHFRSVQVLDDRTRSLFGQSGNAKVQNRFTSNRIFLYLELVGAVFF